MDLARLQEALRELGDELYRAKGFVPTGSGAAYLDVSPGGHVSESGPAGAAAEPGLALIACGPSHPRTEALLARLAAGEFDA